MPCVLRPSERWQMVPRAHAEGALCEHLRQLGLDVDVVQHLERRVRSAMDRTVDLLASSGLSSRAQARVSRSGGPRGAAIVLQRWVAHQIAVP